MKFNSYNLTDPYQKKASEYFRSLGGYNCGDSHEHRIKYLKDIISKQCEEIVNLKKKLDTTS